MKALISLVMIMPTFAMIEPAHKLTPKEQEHLSQVKIEKGGALVLNQFIDKVSGKEKSSYFVKFVCRPDQKKSCKVVDYELLK